MMFVYIVICLLFLFLVAGLYSVIGDSIVGGRIWDGWDKKDLTFVGKLVYYFFVPSKWVGKVIDSIENIPFRRIFFKKGV